MRFTARLLAVVLLGALISIAVASRGIPTTRVGTPVAQAFPNAENVGIVGQSCLPDGTAQVTISWQAYDQGGQWADLSLSNNGFAPGSFVSQGPLPSQQNSLVWGGILPGLQHFLRVNTATFFGWQPSPTIAFFSRGDCAAQPGAGATNVSLRSQTCTSDNRVSINLAWSPSGQGFQWVDLSLYNNGFAPNTFVGIGPLAPVQASVTWDGLLPGYFHFLRINTLIGSIWVPSQTIQFFTRNDCTPAPTPTAPPATPTSPPAPTATATPGA